MKTITVELTEPELHAALYAIEESASELRRMSRSTPANSELSHLYSGMAFKRESVAKKLSTAINIINAR